MSAEPSPGLHSFLTAAFDESMAKFFSEKVPATVFSLEDEKKLYDYALLLEKEFGAKQTLPKAAEIPSDLVPLLITAKAHPLALEAAIVGCGLARDSKPINKPLTKTDLENLGEEIFEVAVYSARAKLLQEVGHMLLIPVASKPDNDK